MFLHGLWAIRLASTAALRILDNVWYAFCTVAGASSAATRAATQARTSSCVMRPIGTEAKVGSRCVRM